MAVALLTALGFAIRLARYQQSIMGDETSTLFIVKGHSLSDVFDSVSSDAEISPPLYFVLAWLATKLGSAPELIRLPSLIAGTASIPLVYLVGARTLGRAAGLVAAAVMTLTPFMIFYSADGRGYAVAIAFLLASTLAMLAAARTGRTGMWVAYGAFSALAMYTHYTSAFVLVAQLAWLFWAHPAARKPALVANIAAAVLFIPWIPSFLADESSPTIDVLSALQGDGFGVKRQAVEAWLVGYPFQDPSDVPGVFAAVLGLVGFLGALLAAAIRRRRQRREAAGAGRRLPWLPAGFVLVLAIAVATPLAELLILWLTGNDLFGARNLVTSSAGVALLIGAVVAGAGRLYGAICGAAVIACFAIGTVRASQVDANLVAFDRAGPYIDEVAGPDDVIVDLQSPRVTPVPLTPLDVYLPQGRPEFRPLLPEGAPPFLPLSPVRPPKQVVREALRTVDGHRLILVTADGDVEAEGDRATAVLIRPFVTGSAPPQRVPLPPDSRIVAERHWDGLGSLNVVVIDPGDEKTGNRRP